MKTFISITIILFFVVSCSTNDIIEEEGPSEHLDEFTDVRDGKTYKYVKIGTQTWMAENLAYLPVVTSAADGPTYNNYEPFENEKFYYVYGYNGNSVNEAKSTDNYKDLGVLYDWNAARSASPAGWHLPTKSEWESLADYISANQSGCTKEDKDKGQISWLQVGGYLKSSVNWNNDLNGTDNYDFRSMAAGFRNNDGNFYGRGNECLFWSNSREGENENGEAYCIEMRDFNQTLDLLLGRTINGFSVRCIKD